MSIITGIRKAFKESQHRDFVTAFKMLKHHGGQMNLIAPGSLTLNNGTSSDVVSDVQTMLDGNVYALAEAAGTPGMSLTFAFSRISEIYGLLVRAYYVGSSTHHCELQMYNYSTSAWDVYLTYESGSGYNVRYVRIPDDTNYISDGAAQLKWEHPDAGNASHDAYIDYVGIEA